MRRNINIHKFTQPISTASRSSHDNDKRHGDKTEASTPISIPDKSSILQTIKGVCIPHTRKDQIISH